MADETKIIYHIDDESTPYLIKLPVGSDRVTLGDFKNALNRPNYKFFFKSMDDDFGVVKEEITDDDQKLPCFNGRVVSWLVAAENSISDSQSNCTESAELPGERVAGIGDSRPPSFHAQAKRNSNVQDDSCDTCTTETDSVASNRRDRGGPPRVTAQRHRDNHHMHDVIRINGHNKLPKPHGFDATSSILSSDLETTSFVDSEDDAYSRFSSATDTTCSAYMQRYRQRRRRRHRPPPISRASSFSSITDSTMSLNIITVTLNMDTINFLGISIVGQSNKTGDGGIYVGSIMKGGAVAQDGRIEPGDMILEVNGVSFENMSNDDAVRTLRESVLKPGPITLVVAKCWDPNPKGYFTVPRQEPVRPIDPGAWIAHTTNALQGRYTSTSSMTSSNPDSERSVQNLTADADMTTVVRAMAQPDSGLDIRDRQWLKITIPNAFIGSDLVDWLNTHVEGFASKKDARKYACNLLKAGYIRHTVNKLTFSEQCYYVFGDICGASSRDLDSQTSLTSSGSSVSNFMPTMTGNLSSLTLGDIDSVSEVNNERDTLGPLPPPQWAPHGYTHNPYGPSPFVPPLNQQGPNFLPPPPNIRPVAPLMMGGLGVIASGGADSASYVSMPPQANGADAATSVYSGSGGKNNACACFVSHTYKQLKKLWIDKGKQQQLQCPHGKTYKLPSYFDPDIDRSTSSSCGSSASDRSQKKIEIKEQVNAPEESDGNNSVVERALPPPPRQLQLQNDDISASRQSFRLAMGNPCDDFQDMGRI